MPDFSSAAVIDQLHVQAADLGCLLEHGRLQLRGHVPGGLARGGRVESEDQAPARGLCFLEQRSDARRYPRLVASLPFELILHGSLPHKKGDALASAAVKVSIHAVEPIHTAHSRSRRIVCVMNDAIDHRYEMSTCRDDQAPCR